MKPCNEFEIVGIKSMGRSKDYYAGYDAAEKNYIRILDKIRAEIIQIANQEKFYDEKWALGLRHAVSIIDKYKGE